MLTNASASVGSPAQSGDGVLDLNYFRQEVVRFREYIGRAGMPQEKRERAFKALSFVYFNIKCANEDETRMLVDLFVQTSDEYSRRETMRAFYPLKQALAAM